MKRVLLVFNNVRTNRTPDLIDSVDFLSREADPTMTLDDACIPKHTFSVPAAKRRKKYSTRKAVSESSSRTKATEDLSSTLKQFSAPPSQAADEKALQCFFGNHVGTELIESSYLASNRKKMCDGQNV